jgi:hypothetical protein
MDPLTALTYDTFRPLVGQAFRDADSGVELELLSVDDLSKVSGTAPEGTRAPFSLMFRGAGELLPQGIRPLAHETLGDLPIFLVPVAEEADGFRYQAVFS